MKLKELLESWFIDILLSALGVILIRFAFEIRSENPYWGIALLSGILLNIPTLYFKIWKYLRQFF